jgi:hypothetical protein
MDYKKNTTILALGIILIFSATTYSSFQSVVGQTQTDSINSGKTNQTETFRSGFDTFVTSMPAGYGIYEEKESSTFSPGEDIILYVEPIGFEYGTLTDQDNKTMYNIHFSAGFSIADTEGNVLAGPQTLAVDEISSHKPNKEVYVPITITQTSPFPPGDYIITYTLTDVHSDNRFDIVKEITIS